MPRIQALSISRYATVMAVLVLLGYLAYGYVTYTELNRVKADVQKSSFSAAQKEVVLAMQNILAEGQRSAAEFARWDEIGQQLSTPFYYAYWRNHRLFKANILRSNVVDAEIYNVSGQALALRKESPLPTQVSSPLPPPYVDLSGSEPYLLIFEKVKDKADPNKVLGYVALRIGFLDDLKTHRAYHYLDGATILFDAGIATTSSWESLVDRLKFKLRANPMADVLNDALLTSMINLGFIMGVITLIIFPALVYLVVRPLRTLSEHIDILRENTDSDLALDKLSRYFPVAETEKIRDSLNDFHSTVMHARRELEKKGEELWDLAHHDALTGVQNRRAFDEHMENIHQMPLGNGMGVAFALFDINHFKSINDTYGHHAGDQVLEAVSSCIQSALRFNELLYRIGGDEFAVTLIDCDEPTALRVAERCTSSISKIDLKELGINEPIRVSIGIAHAGARELEALQTLQWRADVAMYYAKRPGHRNVSVYTADMAKDSESLFSSWVNSAVYEAVITGTGLTLFYQPIVDMGTGLVSYSEALVRISHDNEWIMPSSIFPIVEARHLEVDMDKAVLKTLLEDIKQGHIPKGTGVSMNLSGPSVVNEKLINWMAAFEPYLHDYKIVVEVTETALITHIGVAREHLMKLKNLGFQVALDDFGSGYSSIRYLAHMPVDIVKFDISLIQSLSDGDSQSKIVVHLVRMIKEAGHLLVAEGIEDKNALRKVEDAGFDFAQGYYFSRPERQPMGLNDTRSLFKDR